MAFLISWLSDLLSLNHPTVLFALCIVCFVLICLCFERLQRHDAKVVQDWHLPEPSDHHTPAWYEPAHKGFHKATVVPFVQRQGVRRG